MEKKFSFKLSDRVAFGKIDKEIVFNAELSTNNKYEVTWDSKEFPMNNPVSYTIRDVESAISKGNWIIIK